MFYKYGEVLRKGPDAQKDGKNTYVTTIFCIVSGIIKLSKIMKLPEERCASDVCVYSCVSIVLVCACAVLCI